MLSVEVWWALVAATSASSLSLLCLQHPHLILLLLWQRDRKCPLTLQRDAVCGTGDAPIFCALTSMCLHGHSGRVEGRAVDVRCPANPRTADLGEITVSCCFLQGCSSSCHERHAWPIDCPVWEMCIGRWGLGTWFWVFQRERGVILFFLNPLMKSRVTGFLLKCLVECLQFLYFYGFKNNSRKE